MNISASVEKKDHAAKASGAARYVADYPAKDMLFGQLLRSKLPRAKILDIKLPELPEGYIAVTAEDVPGDNNVDIVMDDTPVFAAETVEFIGDPILMLAGPDEDEVSRLLGEIEVEYEELEPVLDVCKSETVFFDYAYGRGDVDAAFTEADKVYCEEFTTGAQEQAYLETQGMIAEYSGEGGGKATVHGSIQCPYYVYGAVKRAMGTADVRVVQDATGGGFGGKEDYPSIIACQAAVAAKKAGKPVRLVLGRREDMEFTGKRHPSICTYKAAVKGGRVTALDIDVIYDAGAYTTLSAVVLQRGLICSSGVYCIENLRVRGRAVKTNTVPNGAFRGFGAPQTFFSIEMMMTRIARDLGLEPLDFKLAHLAEQGDPTATGGRYHFPVPIKPMLSDVLKAGDLERKRELYRNQTGRYRRGVGVSLFFHGAGFTGSGERDFIKAVVKLTKYADGSVEILAANADMGQGVKTTFAKIVAKELDIPLDRVIFDDPDTDRVPDSGPTVASRSIMTVGELLRRAAVKLKDEWIDGEEQTVEEHFKEPDFVIPFSLDKFEGDAYPTYAWGVNAVEVEVDTLTGLSKVLGAWASFDLGTPIDENILRGQMEGGFLQAIGYASMEQTGYDPTGRIRNKSFSDYIIPTAADVPNMEVLLYNEPYPLGPYGAKGAGELPHVGGAPAYAEAMENALGVSVNHIPFTAQDTMEVLRK